MLALRDDFARSLSPSAAERWFMDAVVYLDENGVYVGQADVPDAVLDRFLPGDTWAAFQTFERWIGATRGLIDWADFWRPHLADRPAPRDAVLLMAIANALGKAERLLNEKEQRSGGASGPRAGADRDAVSSEALLAHRAAFMNKYGTVRGWQKRAGIDFGMSDRAIRGRLQGLEKKRK